MKLNLFKIMNWIFFILAGLLFINTAFFNRATAFFFTFKEQILNFVIITVVFLFIAALGSFLTTKYKSLEKFFKERYIFVVYITMIIVFILQVLYAFLIHSNLEHDIGLIILNAQAGSPDEFVWIEYFSLHPNNFMLLFFFRFIHGALALLNLEEHFIHALVIVNILFVNASIVLVFHTVKDSLDVFKAYAAWIFLILLAAFSPWIIVPYSDTLSMPFIIGVIFLYMKFRNANNRKKLILALGMGAVAQIGYFVKPSSVIPIIAIIIIQFIIDLNLFKTKPKHRRASKTEYNSKYILTCTLLIMLVVSALFNLFVRTQNTIPFIQGVALPNEHYIMIGMQRQAVWGERFTYGSYSAEDFFFTTSFPSTQEMRNANREVIMERLSDFGIAGYSHFLVNKLRWVTDDGTFTWGEFAFGDFYDTTPMQSQLRNLVFPRGDNYSPFAHFMQGIWLFILFWHFIFAFRKKDSSNIFMNVCMCTIIGTILFILLTEGRSRYLINCLPLFAIVSAYCFSDTFLFFLNIVQRKRSKLLFRG
ncbi:MAG: hypothetical protein FWE27_04795 [Defluviitaleaceae bacterium]|nr:hypothetical protein [Defluviitaleaceae bacterium]